MAKPEVTFEEFARSVIDTLEAAEIEYLIGGAVAVAAWGEARTTRDFEEWAQKLNLTAVWYELLGEVDKLLENNR